MNSLNLSSLNKLWVIQRYEIAEFFGFETRNKYEIQTENGSLIGSAAEQQKGLFNFLFRQMLGHWRSFEVFFFDKNRQLLMNAKHPFRFYFQCLNVYDSTQRLIGSVERRFSILNKRFEVKNTQGQVILEVKSPIWRLWTFNFMKNDQEYASIKKKWSGILTEAFTDRDKFLIEYNHHTLDEETRMIILASAIYIDLLYFEKKARNNSAY